MVLKSLTITNKSGLHARPANLFVRTAQGYDSNIKLHAKDRVIDGKSIIEILTLGLANGENIDITAEGVDEVEAVEALTDLVQNGFDD